MPPKLTPEIITAAIEGFESQKRRIDDQIAELRVLLSGGPAESAATPEAPTMKRREWRVQRLGGIVVAGLACCSEMIGTTQVSHCDERSFFAGECLTESNDGYSNGKSRAHTATEGRCGPVE